MQRILVNSINILILMSGLLFPQNPLSYKNEKNNAAIEFTSVPLFGSTLPLYGHVHNIKPSDYKIAVYIFIEGVGWWTKPALNYPLTTILSDSSWVCNIATGGSEIYATEIAAFLLPNGTNPPVVGGIAALPISLESISVAKARTFRYGKSISFSGFEWSIKKSMGLAGPGPNNFSDDTSNVWIDSSGYLHLKITKRNGIWYCPEIISKESFGYGKYTFNFDSQVGKLDKNAVLGLFTWDNDTAQYHREIDIEFSRWGVANDLNAQYVIQPWDISSNRHRWQIQEFLHPSVHSFFWTPDSIRFESYSTNSNIYGWLYKGKYIPKHGNENVRLNLWLMNGTAPTDVSLLEVVVKQFDFITISTDIHSNNNLIKPTSFILHQNYPNPFNPITTISYSIPVACNISLVIYDVLGNKISTLVNEKNEAGRYSVELNGTKYSSGVYYYEIRAGEFRSIKKMILLK